MLVRNLVRTRLLCIVLLKPTYFVLLLGLEFWGLLNVAFVYESVFINQITQRVEFLLHFPLNPKEYLAFKRRFFRFFDRIKI
jgi:hypothetical protein